VRLGSPSWPRGPRDDLRLLGPRLTVTAAGGGVTGGRYEREMERQRREAVAREQRDLPLFTQVRTMAHRDDPETAKEAAVGIAGHLPRLQQRVFAAFIEHGPMTAKTAERLPEFAQCGFSTVRKRISELHQRGLLRDTGRTDNGCTVYEVTPQDRAA
jgi:hypothetical protein